MHTPPSGGGTVICTELHRQGLLSDRWYAADIAYAERHIDPATLAVYQGWTRHVTHWMQRSPLVTRAVAPIARAWAQHMAYEMGTSPTDSRLGAALNAVGLPLHRAVARLRERRPALAVE